MKTLNVVVMLVLIGATGITVAQGSMETEAKVHALCGEYGRTAEAIWRAQSTKKVSDFHPEWATHRKIAEVMLSKDGYIRTNNDAYMRGYSICRDEIRGTAEPRLEER
jgi:hypothetical protein